MSDLQTYFMCSIEIKSHEQSFSIVNSIINANCYLLKSEGQWSLTLNKFQLRSACVLSPVFAQCIQSSSLCLYNPAHASVVLKSCNFFAFRRRQSLFGDDPALCNPRISCDQINKRSVVLSAHLQTPSKAAWIRFWLLALTTVQWNVLCRLLNKLILTRRLLSCILPTQYPSSACDFCSDIEDIYHFLVQFSI
ncbi:hypothetical protein EDC96DRAFT_564751 [Choanephora cucurbitarum]|nr:hypothetical protein EDC96DRAFT_564751 [Choanephora cucurbitarum]